MKPLVFLVLLSMHVQAQFNVTLKYKRPNCGGKKNPDTTSYFLLANKKWMIQYPSGKIDTVYSDINGKVKIPAKKGTYLLYEPWKYYHSTPSDFPLQLYDKNCLQMHYAIPDFTIYVVSNKKYRLRPQALQIYCIDKHPCLRTDTVIPRIPGRN
ncbi:MAG: hypothetical protein Fur0023_08790 [Bacteroidia bacterium]